MGRVLVFQSDQQIWWQAPHFTRIPIGIGLAIVWGFTLYRVYKRIKNAPRRSAKVRQIEVIVVTLLWAFIAGGTLLLLAMHQQ